MDKDDFLLAQIDEFREKAKQLQEMLITKESKAKELQTIVQEREVKADELQQILDERQEKVDGIEAEVARQIDQLIERVDGKMQEIQRQMGTEVATISQSMRSELDLLNRNISGEVNGLERSLSDEIKSIGQNFGGNLEETKKMNEEQREEVRSILNQSNVQMLDSLGKLHQQLEALKAELSDRVHTENVKCFRNIQDLFKAMGDKLDNVSDVEKNVNTVKTFAIALVGLTVINTLGFIAIALFSLGIL